MGLVRNPHVRIGGEVLNRTLTQRLLGPCLIALALLALLIPAALAQAPDGRLQVAGAGTVTTDGKVVMIGWATARKGARITVKDRAGDAQVTVNGQPQPARRGTVQVRRSGQFLISGSRVTITVTGGGGTSVGRALVQIGRAGGVACTASCTVVLNSWTLD